MNLIINPNEPTKIQGQSQSARRTDLDYILDTMRVIAKFRQEYLDLHAQLQSDGVTTLTAQQVTDIDSAKQHIAETMLRFIIWGKM